MLESLIRSLRWVLVGAMIAAGFPQITAAATGSIAGRLTVPGALPAEHAVIHLSRTGAATPITLKTDSQGFFMAAGLNPGISYILEIHDPAGLYLPLVQDRIVVRAGATTWEPFQLEFTVEERIRRRNAGQRPLVNMKEVGNRTLFHHVFLDGLPLFCGF